MNQLITKIKKLHHEHFSLTFVPEDGRSFFEFKLKKLYAGILVLLIAFGSVYSVAMTHATLSLNASLASSLDFNKNLKSETAQQEIEIQSLETDLMTAKDKIDDLTELEYNVRTMVGLSPSLTSDRVNRSADRTTPSVSVENNISLSDSENAFQSVLLLKSDTIDLNSELNLKLEEMNALVKEVEAHLNYIAAYPDYWPVRGKISSYFGSRKHPVSGSYDFHTGLDIRNAYKTSIAAAGGGKVTYASYKNGYGYTVIINHGYGYQTLYAHNSSLLVSVGDYVEKGQIIAKMGSTGLSTGNHCHFEVIKNGVQIDPLKTLQ